MRDELRSHSFSLMHLTSQILPVVDDNHWRLTFYNNVNASLLFLPLIGYYEKDVLIKSIDDQLVSPIFWSAMSVAGFFGFSIGIVTVLQIKATSPLTHNISGTAKAAVQSLMAFYIWGVSSIQESVIFTFFFFLSLIVYIANHHRMQQRFSEFLESSQF